MDGDSSGSQGFEGVLSRTVQLDTLAYLLIAGLMILAVLLGAMIFGSVDIPTGWLLADPWVRLLALALVGGVVIYLLDQHSRLRRALKASHSDLEESKAATDRAFKGLIAAHSAAEIMVSVSETDALQKVTECVRVNIGADAVAIVGDDMVMSAGDGIDSDAVLESISRVAMDSVRRGSSMAVRNAEDGSETIAFPLRLVGQLRGVLCVWRAMPPFASDEREGLQLVARIIELGWESQLLFAETKDRLEGTMMMVTSLIEEQVPGYQQRTAKVRELALNVGGRIGMTPQQIKDLAIAVELRDLGVLDAGHVRAVGSGEPVGSESRHPLRGAHLASIGRFPKSVQHAILCHHESSDGSGYPVHLTERHIPLEARVIKACDAFVELADRAHGDLATQNALDHLRRKAHTSFDPQVVTALAKSVSGNVLLGEDDLQHADPEITLAG
jgi:hypothetical protein